MTVGGSGGVDGGADDKRKRDDDGASNDKDDNNKDNNVYVCEQVIMGWYGVLHTHRSVRHLCRAATTSGRGSGIAKLKWSDLMDVMTIAVTGRQISPTLSSIFTRVVFTFQTDTGAQWTFLCRVL